MQSHHRHRTETRNHTVRWYGISLTIVAALTLAACGGAGGAGPISSPPPTPTPTPPPAPTPTPTPTPTSFNTAEFRRSDGAPYHGAVTAWTAGATGQGVTIGVIDSGAAAGSSEFAGRIHPLSADVAGGNRGFDTNEDNHGTNVAVIALGARNDSGTLGIAFNATLLALRADRPGSCTDTSVPADEQGCSFTDTAIAAGVDRAVTAGARVINISLGGSAPNFTLRQAVGRATAAGIIVVVSSGNDGDGTNPDIPPDQPDPFASGLQLVGNGLVIIAGSNNAQGAASGFANKAGDFANAFLTAFGENVCCDYNNDGTIRTEPRPGGNAIFGISGTSFSAPQIAGAAALLAQAFPNLSGNQIVTLLLNSATDAGDPGTDRIFGRGILSISRAFAPQGTTTLAGTGVAVSLGAPIGSTSGPMGDAGQRGGVSAIILDGYERAYSADLGQLLAAASQRPLLAPALAGRMRHVRAGNAATSISLSLLPGRDTLISQPLSLSGEDASRARLLAGSVITRLSPDRQIGFAIERGSDGLVASMAGRPGHAFLVAEDADSLRLIGTYGGFGSAVRQSLGRRLSLTLAAERGRIGALRTGGRLLDAQGFDRATGYDRVSAALDGRWGALRTSLSLSQMYEDATLLGARLAPGFAGGARTLFVDSQAGLSLGDGWSLGAQWREGWTSAGADGLVAGGALLRSRSWTFDVAKVGILSANDRLSLRVAQPLRVTSGALLLNVPVAYDYATRTAKNGQVALILAPLGQERAMEAAWAAPLFGGDLSLNAFWRTQPRHFAQAPDDVGAAIRFALVL